MFFMYSLQVYFLNHLYPPPHKSSLHSLLITLEILKMGSYQSCFSGYASHKKLAPRKCLFNSLIPKFRQTDRHIQKLFLHTDGYVQFRRSTFKEVFLKKRNLREISEMYIATLKKQTLLPLL